MSYFDKWKVKVDLDKKESIDIPISKKIVNTSRITDFLNQKSNSEENIKIINIPEERQENIYTDVSIEKVKEETGISFLDKLSSIDKSLNVYTDGSCINNGKKDARAGIGVFFSQGDPRNVSRRVDGKQTNNTAELTAILVALDILKNEIDEGRRIVVYTDSEYAIKCFTSYGRRLQSMGFLTRDPVPNLELIKEGLNKIKSNVFFQHIRSHTGKQDIHSLNNEEADKLANKAIGIESKAPKIYLGVSYGNRDLAKEMGAKWDGKRKLWYVHNRNHKAAQLFGILE